jgi:uncharacterized protein HemX
MSYSILSQIQLDGLDRASESSIVSGVLVSIVLILFGVCYFLFRKYERTKDEHLEIQEDFNKTLNDLQVKHNEAIHNLQEKHTEKIQKLNKEFSDKIENIQNNAIKREEERSKQWLESEKETLNVLNGVTSLLEMGEKMDQTNRNTIYLKLHEMENRIISTIQDLKKK